MRRSWLLRTLSIALALLHLAVPALVSIADARLERDAARSGPAIVHVESDGSPNCPRVHHTDCALCAAVAVLAVPARPASVVCTTSVAQIAPTDTRLGRAAAGRSTLALPRAPPAV